MQVRVLPLEQAIDFLHGLLNAALRIACRHQGHEDIRRHAGQWRIGKGVPQDRRDLAQEIIAALRTVRRIVLLEVRQIEVRQRVPAVDAFSAVSFLALRHLGKKEVPAHEIRQGIALHREKARVDIDEQERPEPYAVVADTAYGTLDRAEPARLRADAEGKIRVTDRQAPLQSTAVLHRLLHHHGNGLVMLWQDHAAERCPRQLKELPL